MAEEADVSDLIERILQLPERGSLALELIVNEDGPHILAEQTVFAIQKLLWTKSAILAVCRLQGILLDGQHLNPHNEESTQQFINWIDKLPNPFAEGFESYFDLPNGMSQFSSLIRGFELEHHKNIGKTSEMRLEFYGAYLSNPTTFRFMAMGAASAMTLAAAIWGGVSIMKQLDAPACREHYDKIAQRQIELVRKQAKLEGRLSSELSKNELDIVKSVLAASSTCNSVFGNIRLRIAIGPRFDFEVSLNDSQRLS